MPSDRAARPARPCGRRARRPSPSRRRSCPSTAGSRSPLVDAPAHPLDHGGGARGRVAGSIRVMLDSAASVGPRRSGRSREARRTAPRRTSAASVTRPTWPSTPASSIVACEAPLDRDLAGERLAQVRDRRAAGRTAHSALAEVEQDSAPPPRRRRLVQRAQQVRRDGVGGAAGRGLARRRRPAARRPTGRRPAGSAAAAPRRARATRPRRPAGARRGRGRATRAAGPMPGVHRGADQRVQELERVGAAQHPGGDQRVGRRRGLASADPGQRAPPGAAATPSPSTAAAAASRPRRLGQPRQPGGDLARHALRALLGDAVGR